MKYDWVADQILNHELSDAVTAIVAQGKDDIIDALRAGHVGSKYLDAKARCIHLEENLRVIAEHGDGLARVVAQLALKELDRA